MISVTLSRPWLTVDLARKMRVLSWAPLNPGFTMARRIAWREVRNADLPEGFDALRWLGAEARAAGQGDAVVMLTSRDVATCRVTRAEAGGIVAQAVATVGLSNAEAVGRRLPWHSADFGTINVAAVLGAGLTRAAQVEAMSLAAEARTAAVMEAGWRIATGIATGTGTDCIALACDPGRGRHAGLHTDAGEALGAAVRGAVAAGVADWLAWRRARVAEG
ncbi:MAG: adenosylcobinamide amidohydrolase [Gemmobacter sp.]